MFRTYSEAEIPRVSFSNDSLRLWAYVEQGLQLPWLYVALSERQDGVVLSRMLMLSSVNLFQTLLGQQTTDAWVTTVQLVSPDHLNSSGRWLMEPLCEVLEIADITDAPKGYIYTVSGGRRYIEGSVDHLQYCKTRTVYTSKDFP